MRTARQRLALSAATAAGLVCLAAVACASGVSAAPSSPLTSDALQVNAGEGQDLLEAYGKKHRHDGGSGGDGNIAEQWSSIMGWVSIGEFRLNICKA